MKPILFNTDMVRAILDGRKTVTRRVAKKIPRETHRVERLETGDFECCWGGYMPDVQGFVDGSTIVKSPYKVNDVLYVRETWTNDKLIFGKQVVSNYHYKADGNMKMFDYMGREVIFNWKPSIHMPKEAARLFLRVTNVRVEKLRDMKLEDFLKEGIYIKPSETVPIGSDNMLTGSERQKATEHRKEAVARDKFRDLWNSTAGKPFSPERYANNWYGNPYVWVIEFEVITAEQAQGK